MEQSDNTQLKMAYQIASLFEFMCCMAIQQITIRLTQTTLTIFGLEPNAAFLVIYLKQIHLSELITFRQKFIVTSFGYSPDISLQPVHRASTSVRPMSSNALAILSNLKVW